MALNPDLASPEAVPVAQQHRGALDDAHRARHGDLFFLGQDLHPLGLDGQPASPYPHAVLQEQALAALLGDQAAGLDLQRAGEGFPVGEVLELGLGPGDGGEQKKCEDAKNYWGLWKLI
jgi:hypothetical protein